MNSITLVGETEICTDQGTKSRYWFDWFKYNYQGGECGDNPPGARIEVCRAWKKTV